MSWAIKTARATAWFLLSFCVLVTGRLYVWDGRSAGDHWLITPVALVWGVVASVLIWAARLKDR